MGIFIETPLTVLTRGRAEAMRPHHGSHAHAAAFDAGVGEPAVSWLAVTHRPNELSRNERRREHGIFIHAELSRHGLATNG